MQAAGGATRTRLRDRSRTAGARAREIGAKLRLRAVQGRDEAQATVRRVTGELADLAERAAAEAEKLLVNARRALRRANRTTTAGPTTGTAADRPDLAAGRPGPAASRGRRLDRAARCDSADRRADPPTAVWHNPRRRDPTGQPARPR